jgi:hypothetical protein
MGQMTPAQHERWAKIRAFEIGDPSWALSFEARLARENAWDRAFAARVVAEYKRFVFLMVEAGHPVTPSDEVDQAWHLHMVYTRSYWDEMCTGLLGRPLHHGPTKGGRTEGAKFEDWYARTLASYTRLFGERPPADIWPAAKARFERAPHFARINTSENWIISKSRVRRTTLTSGTLALVAATLAGCGVALAQTGAGLDQRMVEIILILAGIVVLFIVVAVLRSLLSVGQGTRQKRARRDGDSSFHSTSSSSSGCSFVPGAMMGGMMSNDPSRQGSGGEGQPHGHTHVHSDGHSHSHGHGDSHSHSHDTSGGDGGGSGSDSGSSGCGSSGSSGCGSSSSGCGGGGCGGGGD